MKKIFFYSFLVILFGLFSSGNSLAYGEDMDPINDGFENSSTDTTTSNINEDEVDQGELDQNDYFDEVDQGELDQNDYFDEVDQGESTSSSSSSYHGLPATTLSSVLSGILNWLLGILGTVALISFVISGTMYFFAIGDENQVTKAKTMTLYSIIGIIVALSGFIIIKAVNSILQGGTRF